MQSATGRHAAGLAYTAAYALMIAANSVFIAWLVREVSPATLAFGALLIATVLFQLMRLRPVAAAARGRPGNAWGRDVWRGMGVLNACTAITWLGLFYAVQHIRPSVNSMIVNSVGPMLLAVFWIRLRPEVPVLRQEKTAALGVGLSMVLLVGTALASEADARGGWPATAAIGIGIALACGAVQTLTVLTNKRLIEAGIPISDILATRFVLTILVAAALAARQPDFPHQLVRHLPHIGILAITFVVLPAFTLQLGLQRAEPATVTIVLFSIPLITASLELLDPATRFDPFTLAGVVIGVVAAVHGAMARIGWKSVGVR